MLAPTGVYVMVRSPKDGNWTGPYGRVIAGRLRFGFASQRFADFIASEDAAEMREPVVHVDAVPFRSVVDRHYALADTAEAVRYVATTHARAKVVIDVVSDP